MKKNFVLLLSLFLSISLYAQEQEENKQRTNDPLDISVELNRIEELGVPTITLVDEMKAKADTLFNNQKWDDAADAYTELAKKANWLANLLSQCVEPYYSASYKKKESISFKKLSQLTPYENKANYYKKQRDIAYVKIGLCKKNLGDISGAVAYLYRALDLLDINNTEYWDMADTALSEILGFKNE